MGIFDKITGLFESKERKLGKFFVACGVGEKGRLFYSAMTDQMVPVEYLPSLGHEKREFYLFHVPHFNPKTNVWVLGGDPSDEMVTVCCEPEAGRVLLIEQYISVDDIDSEIIEGSADEFLDKCEVLS